MKVAYVTRREATVSIRVISVLALLGQLTSHLLENRVWTL